MKKNQSLKKTTFISLGIFLFFLSLFSYTSLSIFNSSDILNRSAFIESVYYITCVISFIISIFSFFIFLSFFFNLIFENTKLISNIILTLSVICFIFSFSLGLYREYFYGYECFLELTPYMLISFSIWISSFHSLYLNKQKNRKHLFSIFFI